jgi:hypothetical protein
MSMFELVFELEGSILMFSNDDRIVSLYGCVLFFDLWMILLQT